jgi:isopenicillin N synthase-like dioxygenase
MYSFFRERNRKIEPTPDVLMIPEFKKLWDRDKTKEKVQAKNDLAIVYYLGYFNSPMNVYGENKLPKVAEQFKGDPKWKPEYDKDVKAALDLYREMQRTPSLRILESIRESLETSDSVISQVSQNITKIAKKQNEEQDDTKSLKNMEKLFSYINNLLKLQGQIPQSINSIIDLENKVFDELSSKRVRGGGKVGSRERPSRNE